MVQVLAVKVILMSEVVEVDADDTSTSAVSLPLVLVLIYLLGRMRPGADIADMPMIPAFGEILGSADWADGARPSLSGTHYGLPRQCGAKVGKQSSAFGSPAELASPMRLGSMSAHLAATASRTAQYKGKRYGRQCRAEPATDSHPVIPPAPKGDNRPGGGVPARPSVPRIRALNIIPSELCNHLHQRRQPARKSVKVQG
jgi:hypothetical protein